MSLINKISVSLKNNLEIVLLLGFAFLLYIPVITFGAVFDDVLHLNHFNKPDQSIVVLIKSFWTGPVSGMYIPVVYSFWTILAKASNILFPSQPDSLYSLLHSFSLLIHLANGALLAILIHHFSSNRELRFIVTALFLIHPVQVESVAWISELRGLLAVFFSLIALILLSSGLLNPSKYRYKVSISTLFFLLAMLCKPSVVVLAPLPLFIPYVLAIKLRYTHYIISGLWLVLGLAITLVSKIVQPDSIISFQPVLWERLLVMIDTYWFYTQKLLFGFNTGLYNRAPQLVVQQNPIALFSVMLGFLLLTVYLFKKNRLLGYSLIFFFLSILPVSGVISFVYQNWSTVADRYLYLSVISFGLLTAVSLGYIKSDIVRKSLLALILGYFSFQSFMGLNKWRGNESLWKHALNHNSDFPLARGNYAEVLLEKGDTNSAIYHYQESLFSKPAQSNPHLALARIFSSRAELYKSLYHFSHYKSFVKSPSPNDLLFEASIYLALYQTTKAEQILNQTAGILNSNTDSLRDNNAVFAEYYFHKAVLSRLQNNLHLHKYFITKADSLQNSNYIQAEKQKIVNIVAASDTAISQRDNIESPEQTAEDFSLNNQGNDTSLSALEIYQRASKHFEQGELLKSENLLLKAIESYPQNPNLFRLLAQVYFKTENVEGQNRALENWVRYAPDNVDAMLNLAIFYGSQGEIDRAKYMLDIALFIDPLHSKALEVRDVLAASLK
jgi:hypothetical protein